MGLELEELARGRQATLLAMGFSQGLCGLFGGIRLVLYVAPEGFGEGPMKLEVRCEDVYDFRLEPEYTLLEGISSLELLSDDPLLERQRLDGLWCDENEPRVNKDNLRLLRFGGGYVIAERFETRQLEWD
jgi:hypothetical protein